MVGQMLEHYRIGEPLGAGGMEEVYRARDTRLERDVAYIDRLTGEHGFNISTLPPAPGTEREDEL